MAIKASASSWVRSISAILQRSPINLIYSQQK
jgi:hypothetical protein